MYVTLLVLQSPSKEKLVDPMPDWLPNIQTAPAMFYVQDTAIWERIIYHDKS